MNPWLAALSLVTVLAVIWSALLTLQVFEFRRFTRSRVQNPLINGPSGRALVLAPCRGLDPGFQHYLRPLFEQDYAQYSLLFIVDSSLDPACAAIRALFVEYPQVDARLLVAGRALDCGQKVHNLLAATEHVDADVRYLAFVDSDARPQRDWLRLLVQHLESPGVVAATAYRWFVPERNSLPNLLLASLDAGIAALVGPGRHGLIWGGSWAIRSDGFEACRLREAWQGTLSDDLVASSVVHRVGRVEFEPACLLASPINFAWPGLLAFVRRQLTIGRCYATWVWRGATIAVLLTQIAFWGSLALLPLAVVRGRWWWSCVVGATLLYLLQSLRAWLRQDAMRHALPDRYCELVVARRFDIWCHPLTGALACWGLLRSAVGRRVEWRGIVYQLGPDGQVQTEPPSPDAATTPNVTTTPDLTTTPAALSSNTIACPSRAA